MERQMKKFSLLAVAFMALVLFSTSAYAFLTGLEAHKKLIYPVVRITYSNTGGSGTVVYSKSNDDGKFSTYVLTNFHVIEDAITITDEWDTDLQKEIKKEKRSIVYVEIFQYRDVSTPVGTLKVEATIELYNKDEDMALIKLLSEKKVEYVAELYPHGNDSLRVMDETVAVGCSLLFPPLPTTGILTRKNHRVDSLPFHMSSSQIIYGNSGGGMFTGDGKLIGIPSLVAIAGWSTPITHMGLFIPISRIYKWLENEHYHFIYDPSICEEDCLLERDKEIKAKQKKK